jgi:hypothetical protein
VCADEPVRESGCAAGQRGAATLDVLSQQPSGHGGAAGWVRGTARCSWRGKLACCVHVAADDFVLLLRDLLAACMLKPKGIGRGWCVHGRMLVTLQLQLVSCVNRLGE